jgi:hypothetical protein
MMTVETQMRSLRMGLALLVLAPMTLVAVAVHAQGRRQVRALEQPALDAVMQRFPAGDLALSGGSRWLRFPSMEEPGAAFADGPAVPDPDPAGAAIAPPREVWSLSERGP